eukprot:1026516_1
MSAVSAVVFLILLFTKSASQCLSAPGSCNTVYESLPGQGIGPPYSFIQTFDVSTCVSDNQLEISEISFYYQYYVSNAISLDFQIELFIPSSLNALSPTDANSKIATVQKSINFNTIMYGTRKRVRFTNLNITLGCTPHFGMFVYPLNCNGGSDPSCDSTSELKNLNLFLCAAPAPQETLFVYDDTGSLPPALTSIGIMNPADSHPDVRIEVDIVFRSTTLCIPTAAPTPSPTPTPTPSPTPATHAPTNVPTDTPTKVPIRTPTVAPLQPTKPPSATPTKTPTKTPTTRAPTPNPSRVPTSRLTSEQPSSPTTFGEAEVNPHSTSFESGAMRPTTGNENKRTVDTIIMIVIIIISLLVVVAIVYWIYKFYYAKNRAKQAISAVMETTSTNNTVATDDIVNTVKTCTRTDTSAGTDEHVDTVDNVLPEDTKGTKAQPGATIDLELTKSDQEDGDASGSSGDELYADPHETNDGFKVTCEGTHIARCAACAKEGSGKTSGDDGYFYCMQCWNAYENEDEALYENPKMTTEGNKMTTGGNKNDVL